MKPEVRTALAFLAASIVPAAYLAVAFPLSGYHDAGSTFGTFVVVYYFSAVATGLLGFPAFLLLSKLNLVAWWSSIMCGALTGAASLVAVSSNIDNTTALRFLLLGPLLASFSGSFGVRVPLGRLAAIWPNPSIERTCSSRLRLLAPAAHVKR